MIDTEITVQYWQEVEDGPVYYSVIQSINNEPEVLAYGESETLEEAEEFAKTVFQAL